MSSRFMGGSMIDFQAAAFKVVSGNASGVTPIVSGWVHVGGVRFSDWLFVTGATTNVVWTIDVANNAQGNNPTPLPAANVVDNTGAVAALPTGINQNATRTILVPEDNQYIRFTGTPSAGSGAVEASPGVQVSQPQIYNRCRTAVAYFYCPASATLAGQAALEFSVNYNPAGNRETNGNLPPTTGAFGANPERWMAAMKHADDGGAALTIAALVASTGQEIMHRLGQFECVALRAKFTPTAGFGRYQVLGNAKG
jgi:hypothetical protein